VTIELVFDNCSKQEALAYVCTLSLIQIPDKVTSVSVRVRVSVSGIAITLDYYNGRLT